MNGVFCLFHTDSDGYTYSADTLIGVFLTQDDAEAALLYHIEWAVAQCAKLKAYHEKCYFLQREQKFDELRALSLEWGENHKPFDGLPDDENIDNYPIRQFVVGKIDPDQ